MTFFFLSNSWAIFYLSWDLKKKKPTTKKIFHPSYITNFLLVRASPSLALAWWPQVNTQLLCPIQSQLSKYWFFSSFQCCKSGEVKLDAEECRHWTYSSTPGSNCKLSQGFPCPLLWRSPGNTIHFLCLHPLHTVIRAETSPRANTHNALNSAVWRDPCRICSTRIHRSHPGCAE